MESLSSDEIPVVYELPTVFATVSIICPTIGRGSLAGIRDAALDQMMPGDQFIAVGDGPHPESREIMESPGDPRLIYAETDKTGHWGAEQVDEGIRIAKGDYIVLIGDDDVLDPKALEVIRNVVSVTDKRPYLFCMGYEGRQMGGSFASCECSGQQLVFPNIPGKIARYANDHEANNDWIFMQATVALWEGRLEMRAEVISHLLRRNWGRV